MAGMAVKHKSIASNIELIRLLNFGEHALAVDCAQAALRNRPSDSKLWQLLGLGHMQLGRHRDALAALRRAAELAPGDAEIRDNLRILGTAAGTMALQAFAAAMAAGDLSQALSMARRAVRDEPQGAARHNNLAVALAASQRLPEAIDASRRAVTLAPQSVEFQLNLARFLMVTEQEADGPASYRRVLELDPENVEARRLLAWHAAHRGDPAEAAAYCSGGRNELPRDLSLLSNRLYYGTLDGSLAPEESFAAHAEYGRRAEAAAPAAGFAFAQPCDPARRLRVGFVSGDLYDHPVAGFIEPVWAALDRTQIEVWVYAGGAKRDAVTERLRPLAQVWRDVQDLGDEALAARIHADAIDVLFDLSGHTAGHRLPSFAMKPAPVQVTWIGYPNTTGLRAMDYALCDRFNAPPGLYEHFYVEKFARIPCSGTFTPLARLPEVGPLPALAAGRVCFGSFNAVRKLGPEVVAGWALVLHAVPDARLLIGHVAAPAQAQRLEAEFARQGIAAARLQFRPSVALADYLALHGEVDLLLDSWPYGGGTTTNYALAMGVPVVTLRGPGRAHCQSAGVLGRIGLGDWVARDVDEFVAIAAARAGDLPALVALRAGLRDRWRGTPLRQPAVVARGLERAVRRMWQRWCAGLPAEHFEIGHDEVPGLAPARAP